MRKLKENFGSSLKLDVVELSNDFPEISIDKLATELADNLGVDISKEEDDGTVYMVINDTDTDTVIDEISDILYAKTDMEDLDEIKSIVSDFIIEDDLNEAYDYQTIDDIPPSPYYNEYPDIDYPDEAFDDYDEEDYPPYDEYDEMDDYPPYDEIEECGECDDDDCLEDDEFEDDEYDDDDALNDCVDNDKFMDEDDEFECYESKKYLGNGIKYLGNGIYEKKSTCCPKRRGKRMVNLSESLSRRNNVLTESIINRAIRKARKEKNSRNSLRVLKETLGTDKFNMVVNAMKEGRKYLYENKKINGKRLSEYSAKKLFSILKEIKEQYNLLNKRLHSLNESASLKEEIELNEKIENKLKLMNILDEELTYRLTIKRLLEEEENNPLEPLDVNPNEMDDSENSNETDDSENSNETDDSENPEEDEEVELSRVVITVANQDAADELKTSMVDAGIPEDAIEFETEESEEGEEGEETEETEETEGEEGEETEGESNESIFYKKFKKLLEDDAEGEESDGDEESETDEESDGEETEGEEESEDSEDEESVKVVLTNTDYINDLANVLETEYGITKDEFEEMIGGEIIQDDDDSDDDSDDESDDESDDDKSDDDSDEKEDKKSSKGDDAVDAMSPEELDKLFGNN